MNKYRIVVKQTSGYYVLDLHICRPRRVEFAFKLAVQHAHIIAEARKISADIEENFEVSKILAVAGRPSILIECKRSELRKIETWLSLGHCEVQPLRQWKNERA